MPTFLAAPLAGAAAGKLGASAASLGALGAFGGAFAKGLGAALPSAIGGLFGGRGKGTSHQIRANLGQEFYSLQQQRESAARYNKDVVFPRADFEYNRALRDANTAIRRRVADAKAAGLHPLFALGAAGASYSPTIQAGTVPPGQAVTGSFASDATARTAALADAIGTGVGAYFDAKRQRASDLRAARIAAAQVRSLEARARADEAQADWYAFRIRDATNKAISGPRPPPQAWELAKPRGSRVGSGWTQVGPQRGRPSSQQGYRGYLKVLGETVRPGTHAPAQLVEDQYGDIVGMAHGLGSYIDDRIVASGAADNRIHRNWDHSYYIGANKYHTRGLRGRKLPRRLLKQIDPSLHKYLSGGEEIRRRRERDKQFYSPRKARPLTSYPKRKWYPPPRRDEVKPFSWYSK